MRKYVFFKSPVIIIYVVLIILAPNASVQCTTNLTKAIDRAQAGNYDKVLELLPLVFLFFVLHGLLLYWIKLSKAHLIRVARKKLKEDLFNNVFHINNDQYFENTSGEYIAMFSNDISLLEYKYFNSQLEMLQDFSTLITYVSALFLLNPVLGGVILFWEIISIFTCLLTRKNTIRDNKIYISALAHFTQRLKDFFTAFPTIRNFAAEQSVMSEFDSTNNVTEEKKIVADTTVNFSNIISSYFNSFLKFLLVSLGVILMLTRGMTIGTLLAAYKFTDDVVGPIHGIIAKLNSINAVGSIIRRVKAVANSRKEEERQTTELKNEFSGISFNHVSFSKNGNTILDDIEFEFEPNKRYLIIGRNGSGKSSMLRLMKRFSDDYTGSILIGDQDIKTINSEALTSVISYTNEHSVLLDDTVYNNIALYRNVKDEQVYLAAKIAGVNIPFDRVIRDGGKNLSSGERRRVELARCLINSPSVMVLDEAISTLDIRTAYEIEKTILSMNNITTIFVSHNFSSALVDRYDTILLMDNGRITEYGTHKELLESSNTYRKLMQIKCGSI